jgi:hypothetical protein
MSIIAEKHDLYVEYVNNQNMLLLGIELYSGTKIYEKTEIMKNENFFTILKEEKIEYNINPNEDYFQSEEISDLVYKYIKERKEKIIEKNEYKNRYNNNKDIFIHIRLTDAEIHNPGIEYYKRAIKKVIEEDGEYDKIYIGSDNIEHKYIEYIKNNYKNVEIIKMDEISTIKFGSTCKNIIISHGSYSAVIGYLGFNSKVYYLHKEPKWCPLGMFTNKGFISV